jgi:hypothetical protein
MESVQQPKLTKAWIDAAAAAAFVGMFALLLNGSRVAAEEAVRLYGHNVDSGAYEYIAAVLYFAPGAILFVLAAVALFSRWRAARFLHGIAWGWVALPLVATAILWLSSLVAG